MSSGVPPSSPGIVTFREPASSPSRNSSGSTPAACASSSTKLSITNALPECSTERHHITGTAVSTKAKSMRRAGIA